MKKIKKRTNRKKKDTHSSLLWKIFFKKILQNIAAIVMVTDKRERVVFANKKWLDFFRSKRASLADRSWITNFVVRNERLAARNYINAFKKENKAGCFEVFVKPARGEKQLLRWQIIPLKENSVTLYLYIGRGRKARSSVRGKLNLFGKTWNKARREVAEIFFESLIESEAGTARHAARVMMFSVLLAEKMKMKKPGIERLKAASLLHDLGKLAVDEKILLKKRKLSEEDFNQIKKHPAWSAKIVSLVSFFKQIESIILSHHENYDGTGYPKGIKGEQIPLESRVLAAADIYEALTSDRPYRKAFSKEKALSIIEKEKGKKLDPHIADVFLDMMKTEDRGQGIRDIGHWTLGIGHWALDIRH